MIRDDGFSAPRAPVQPNLKVTALNEEAILEWGSDFHSTQATEVPTIARSYHFEGYNVYQLPSATASLQEATRIATFDIVNDVTAVINYSFDSPDGNPSPVIVASGTNSGIQRQLDVKQDYFGGFREHLHNGKPYYFGVTAYNYSSNPATGQHSFESKPVIVTVVPEIPFGVRTSTSTGDSILVSHTAGSSNGFVSVTVVDPLQSSGQSYEVRFDTSSTATLWSLKNTTTSSMVFGPTPVDTIGRIVEGGILLKAGYRVQAPPLRLFLPDDIYSYTLPEVQTGLALQQASAARVGVFPNPYYAGRSQETSYWRQFVTFNNLPPRATIRIFNLAGQLVRKLEKNDPSQFFEWDLTNENHWQVASGMYICFVEMPDIGETKVLKLAVIQPQILSPY
jgi:hypothetical protein